MLRNLAREFLEGECPPSLVREMEKDPLGYPPGLWKQVADLGWVGLAIPEQYEIQIRPRSGLAAKNGISVLNTPGTIDSDYRGEIKVILINHGKDIFEIKKNDRIAQMIVCPIIKVELEEVESLPETVRGKGGFGSTDK